MHTPTIRPATHGYVFPASSSQQRLWFLDRLAPGQASYHVPAAVRIEAAVDRRALQGAVDGLRRRHESLGPASPKSTGGCCRSWPRGAGAAAGARDRAPLPQAVERLIAQEARLPFDLGRPSLFRVVLLSEHATRHILVVTCHHSIADGLSLEVLFRDLATLYAAHAQGAGRACGGCRCSLRTSPPGSTSWPRPVTASSPTGAASSPTCPSRCPCRSTGRDRPSNASKAPRSRSRSTTRSPTGCARSARAPTPRCSWCSSRDSRRCFNAIPAPPTSPSARRCRGGITSRCATSSGSSSTRSSFEPVSTTIRRAASCWPACAHRAGRVGASGRALRADRGRPGAAPHPGAPAALPGALRVQSLGTDAAGVAHQGLQRLAVETGTSKCDLTLSLVDDGAAVTGVLEFDTDLFERVTIERMRDGYLQWLRGLAADPDAPVSAIELLSAPERAQLERAWNDTARPYPRDAAVHALVAARAAGAPSAPASSRAARCSPMRTRRPGPRRSPASSRPWALVPATGWVCASTARPRWSPPGWPSWRPAPPMCRDPAYPRPRLEALLARRRYGGRVRRCPHRRPAAFGRHWRFTSRVKPTLAPTPLRRSARAAAATRRRMSSTRRDRRARPRARSCRIAR